jgi:hypothetical protein
MLNGILDDVSRRARTGPQINTNVVSNTLTLSGPSKQKMHVGGSTSSKILPVLRYTIK